MAAFNSWAPVSENTVKVADGPIKNPKKITGSRLGAVAGLNKWKTPFQAWCEIMRVAEEPFVENKYTVAGNTIEPKLIEWSKVEVSPNIKNPEEFYGVTDAKKAKRYDFFADNPIFGGMWDAVVLEEDTEVVGVVEAKTSSRPQDWMNGVPDSYAVQGLAYAKLIARHNADKVERVFFPAALLDPSDYDDPSRFVCTDDNTVLYELSTETWTSADGRSINDILDEAEAWWERHVVGNVSPPFDEKLDKKYLDIMRTNEVTVHDELEAAATEAAVLEAKIEAAKSEHGIVEMEKRLKHLKDKQLKPMLQDLFGKTDTKVTAYGWKLTKTESTTIDKEALEKDDLLEKYSKPITTYRLTKEK